MRRAVRFLVPVLLSFAFFSCGPDNDAALVARSRRVFGTLPRPVPAPGDTPQLVHLGRMLYFSNELSVNRTQSCNTCHPIDRGRPGADGQSTSDGALGKMGPVPGS